MKKLSRLYIRLTEKEKNRIKMLAHMYAGGNISLWLIYSVMNAPRKFIDKSNMPKYVRIKKAKGPVKAPRTRTSK